MERGNNKKKVREMCFFFSFFLNAIQTSTQHITKRKDGLTSFMAMPLTIISQRRLQYAEVRSWHITHGKGRTCK